MIKPVLILDLNMFLGCCKLLNILFNDDFFFRQIFTDLMFEKKLTVEIFAQRFSNALLIPKTCDMCHTFKMMLFVLFFMLNR